MRLKIPLVFDDGSIAVIKEIRPIDFLTAIEQFRLHGKKTTNSVTVEEWNVCWLELGLIEFKNLNDENIKIAFNKFFELNKSFFSINSSSSSQQTNTGMDEKLSQLVTELRHECAVLSSYNHKECWDYGFNYFQVVKHLHKKT